MMISEHNPILEEKDISRWSLLKKRPVPEPGTVMIWSGDGKNLFTIGEGSKGLTNSELLWGKYNRLYIVDIGKHQLNFQCKLPCATDELDFDADVKLVYSVSKPELIVKNRIYNVSDFLVPQIEDLMRCISRRYEARESGEAERIIGRKLEEEVSEVGFKLNRFIVKLSLEEETRTEIKDVGKNTAIKKAQLKSEIELEEYRRRLQNERLFSQSQYAELQEESKLRLAKRKIDFYAPLIEGRNWEALAAQLVDNPEESKKVINALMEQKQIDKNDKQQLLKLLIDEDAIDVNQLTGAGKALIEDLTGVSRAALESSSDDGIKQSEDVFEEIEEEDFNDSVPDEFKRKDEPLEK